MRIFSYQNEMHSNLYLVVLHEGRALVRRCHVIVS